MADTPVEDLKLSAGMHNIRLVNPRQQLSKTIRLRIRPNRVTRRVVDLR